MSKVYKDKFIQLFCMTMCFHLILMIFIKKSDGRLVGLSPKLVNLASDGNHVAGSDAAHYCNSHHNCSRQRGAVILWCNEEIFNFNDFY